MSQIMVNAIITYYSSNTILECILMYSKELSCFLLECGR